MDASRFRLVTLTLLTLAPAFPVYPGEVRSSAATPLPEDRLELDEVVVRGSKSSLKPSEMIAWMRRLIGQFVFEGHIISDDGIGPETQHLVRGRWHCIGFDPTPAVQCEMNGALAESRGENGERIPSGSYSLDAAAVLFGLDPDETGILFMLVDNNGVAEPSMGKLSGDTLVARAPCISPPDGCQRVTHITADSKLREIDMKIDITVDHIGETRYRFLMQRIPALNNFE